MATFNQKLSAVEMPDIKPAQMNTGSSTGDALQTLAFGLQAYSAIKGKEQERKLISQDAEQEDRISKGVSSLITLREDTISQFGAKGEKSVGYLKRRDEALSGYSESDKIAVFKKLKEVTGQSVTDFSTKVTEDDLTYQDNLRTGQAYASVTLGLPLDEVNNLSEKQQFEYYEKAKQEAKDREARLQKLDETLKNQQVNKGKKEAVTQSTTETIAVLAKEVKSKIPQMLINIENAYSSGNIELATQLANEFKGLIAQSASGLGASVNGVMSTRSGEPLEVDQSVINAYSDDIRKILLDPSVEAVLTGKSSSDKSLNQANALINTLLSDQFLSLMGKGAKTTEEEKADILALTQHLANIKGGQGLVVNKSDAAIRNAFGLKVPDPNTKTNNTADLPETSSTLISFMNRVSDFFSTKTESGVTPQAYNDIKTVQDTTGDFVKSKLENGTPISGTDANWVMETIFSSTSYRPNVGITASSKSAMEPVLDVLASPNYKEAFSGKLDTPQVTDGLWSSLDAHLKNHVHRAFTQLDQETVRTSNPSNSVFQRSNTPFDTLENLKDFVELVPAGDGIKFQYKKVTGKRFTPERLMKLNSITETTNKYLKAIANVSEASPKDLQEQFIGVLTERLGITPPQESTEAPKQ